MKKSIFILLIVMLVGLNLSAQHITRKGSLGVGLYQQIADSIKLKYNLKETKGALIKDIFPNTTASTLKLQAGDLITEVNGVKIINTPDLLQAAKTLRAGDKIVLKVLRNNEELPFKGNVVAKPYDKMPNADVEYDEFAFEKGWIRCMLFKPKGVQNPPVVYFIQGFSCVSMDNIPASDPVKMLWQSLIDKGIAVYCIEKSGVGDNLNTSPCEEIGFNTETAIFEKGYAKLLNIKSIDASQIYIFGHSLGGVIAPLVANTYQPKGVVVYGTVLKPWGDYMLDVNRIQRIRAGESIAYNEKRIEQYKPTFAKIFKGGKSPEALKNNPSDVEAMQQGLAWDGNNRFYGRHYTLMTEMDRINLYEKWAKVKSKVLVLYGEEDEAAMYPDGHQEIAQIVDKNNAGKAKFISFPKTTHAMLLNDETPKLFFNPAIAKELVIWIQSS